MKQLLFTLIALVMISNVVFSQKMYLNATRVLVKNMQSGETASKDVNVDFLLTDYSLKCTSCESVLKWTFIGETYKTSDTQFYVYAKDMDGTKCRIWFQAASSSSAVLGIEYSDMALLYYVVVE